jgi:hypothetical protein
LLAEQLRVQRYLRPLALYTPFTRLPPQETYGDARWTWMYWYLRAARREIGIVTAKMDAAYLEDCRRHLLFLVKDQQDFHDKTQNTTKRLHATFHRSAIGLFCLTALACAAHLLGYAGRPEVLAEVLHHHEKWLTFVTAVFPALGAALAAINNQCELARVERRSRAMSENLKLVGERIAKLGSPEHPLTSRTLGVQALDVGESMTVEVLDWRTLLVTRGIDLPA